MTVEQENVERLKRAYAHWGEHRAADCSCWTDLAADDLRMRSLGEGAPAMPFTAPRTGKQELVAYLDGLTRDWEMIDHAMDDFIAQGDRVVVIGRAAWRHKGTGKVADTPKVDIWRFRDGQAVEYAEFFDTARAYAAAMP